MNIKKRGLNRGLNALLAGTGLFPNPQISNVQTGIEEVEQPEHDFIAQKSKNLPFDKHSDFPIDTPIYKIKIQQLIPGKFQPRRTMQPEELSELVESVKKQGILQPLIVRKLSDNSHEIIAGERRWRAATIAGLDEVPVIIKNVNDQDALTIALIENIQRSDLNPLEEAIALDRLTKEFTLTHNEVAIAVGKSRTVITNLLRILQLPTEIKQMLEQQKIDLGHAKVLLGAPYNLQLKIANKVVENNLSVRATEQLLKKSQPQILETRSKQDLSSFKNDQDLELKNLPDPDVSKLQKKLSEFLGTKVIIETNINNSNKNKGKLIISYNSLEELEGILEHLNVELD